MSDRENLLNNLKIDRSAPPAAGGQQSSKLYLLAISVLIVGLFWWLFLSDDELKEVTTFTVKSLEMSDASATSILDASGYVVARRRATVSSKMTGKVMKVFIEEGMYVEEGQILAQLDDSTMQADLNYSQSQLNEAKRIFNRTQELAKDELASQAALDAARASVEGLEALNAIRKQVVQDMKILAPFSGVVVYKAAQPGEMISPVSAGGGFTNTGICTIVDMDSLEVEVDVNEAFINRVKPGQPVITNLNAYPKWDIPSEVIAIIPTADRNKATVKVRIALLEKDERVLPDMGSRVSFLRKVENKSPEIVKEGVMIPLAAVAIKDDQSVVQALEGSKIRLTKVEVAEETANYARVIDGLKSGMTVVAIFDNELENNQQVIIK
ncbi:efflux RND transporter periplasmic adaptor subunit [SAR86 cluster bacterium]|nr:efflux RND transporter periplasmic adaptor subunit [SAR86 cluster bacterium]|tara:strand:+ start:566 stop:1711 length:1146 start_codon:yes stop_codon:yes gene_type:complete